MREDLSREVAEVRRLLADNKPVVADHVLARIESRVRELELQVDDLQRRNDIQAKDIVELTTPQCR